MFNRYLKFCLVLFCALLLSACATSVPPGSPSYTIISDQSDKMRKHYTVTGTEVVGKDCFTTLFYFLIWFGTSPTEETLLSKVLEENNADALIDAEFKHSFHFFPLIFTRSCLTITGVPVKLKGAL